MDAEQLKTILGNHGKWLRGEVGGVKADLSLANLRSANLRSADLSLANLRSADLRSADLSSANLSLANLRSADLRSAKYLEDACITGEPWSEYLSTVVPALLTAGGKTLDQIVTSGAWGCHSWDNCPMAVAFGVHSPSDTPLLLRPRVEQFVQLFDQKLIPCPVVSPTTSV